MPTAAAADRAAVCGLADADERRAGRAIGIGRARPGRAGRPGQADLLPYLLLTSSAERVYSKPRGYAGDFMSIEEIYQNQAQGTGRLGPLIDRCFLHLAGRQGRAESPPDCWSTRSAARATPPTSGQVRITSLACGPAEEVFDVLAESGESSRLHATLMDFDEEALAFVKNVAIERGVLDRLTLAQANLIYLAVGRHRLELPPQDLVYSVGLIDYFSDRFVLKLMNYAHALLRPGGRLILGNFHPAQLVARDHGVRARMEADPPHGRRHAPACSPPRSSAAPAPGSVSRNRGRQYVCGMRQGVSTIGRQHALQGRPDPGFCTRADPPPVVIEAVGKGGIGRDVPRPAFAIAQSRHERIRPQLLGHQLVTHKGLSRQDDQLRRAEVDTRQVDGLAAGLAVPAGEPHGRQDPGGNTRPRGSCSVLSSAARGRPGIRGNPDRRSCSGSQRAAAARRRVASQAAFMP